MKIESLISKLPIPQRLKNRASRVRCFMVGKNGTSFRFPIYNNPENAAYITGDTGKQYGPIHLSPPDGTDPAYVEQTVITLSTQTDIMDKLAVKEMLKNLLSAEPAFTLVLCVGIGAFLLGITIVGVLH